MVSSSSFTNLNKVFYPREGYTKRDVINYYNSVADLSCRTCKGVLFR